MERKEYNEYNGIVKELSDKFSKTLPNTEDNSELVKHFEIYLRKYIVALKAMKVEEVESIIKLMSRKVEKLSLIQKKQKLIEDKSFNEIQSLSNKAFEMAKSIIRGQKSIDISKTKEMKEKMKERLESVRDFNKEQAKLLVSEGILDLMFVENPKTEMFSLRIGRNMNKIKKRGGNNE